MENLHRRIGYLLIPVLICGSAHGNQVNGDDQELMADLLQLLNTPVVSASKSAEKLSMAPATMIVLTRSDLSKRGYTELTDILNDLPGMQLARAYGDSYVKNYWRGFRNFINDPYLLMVDGVVENSLYFNRVDTALTTMPMSNIERVEVVYGPASVVYGSNAFMGVINVITKKDAVDTGVASFGTGSNQHRFADATFSSQFNEFQVQAAFRYDTSVVDKATSEEYEYTKNKYYADRSLWGVFVDNPSIGGRHHSENLKQGVDLRLRSKAMEIGFQSYDLKSGYGNEYAADLVQNAPMWHKRDTNFFLKHHQEYTDSLKGSTLLRYRESGVLNDSVFLDAGPYAGDGVWGAAYSFWLIQNHSTTFTQDFEWKAMSELSFLFGVSYEKRDNQKSMPSNYGPYQPSGATTAYPYPQPIQATTLQQNRILTENRGVYVQGRWMFAPDHSFILGGRRDGGTSFSDATTLRMGYVGQIGGLSLKALYGEAFQEPTPRLLYGGWAGSGSDPNLEPETSDTIELSAAYTTSNASAGISLWQAKDYDTILNTAGGAKNLGDRTLRGADMHLQYQKALGSGVSLRTWAHISLLFSNSGTNNPDATGAVSREGLTTEGKVGDLAKAQVRLGATLDLGLDQSFTLLGRYIGARKTVATNPVGEVDSYFIGDLVYVNRNLFSTKLGLSAKISNLFNKTYFEPGIQQGNAGDTPGQWTDPDTWSGSGGYFSSLLAQPGREINVSFSYRY